jgi:hypothetical protein
MSNLTCLELIIRSSNDHVRWDPCHDGMAHPQVTDRGDSNEIWKVSVNKLNKQLQTAGMGWSSSFRVGHGANNSSS